MRTSGMLLSALLISSSVPALAQLQNLQPESQQEFRRTFGFSSGSNNSTPFTVPVSPNNLLSRTLQPSSVQEFQRIFGQNAVSGTAELQQMSTPSSINSTILSTVLASTDPRKYFILWHLITLDVAALDHRADLASNPSTYHEQFGPARTSRAMALIHQAMFEAANVFDHKYASTIPDLQVSAPAGASADAAIVEAAYQIITWLYPGLNEQKLAPSDSTQNVCQSGLFSLSVYHQCSLTSITNTTARDNGVAVGRAIAGSIIASRSHDGAEIPEPVWGKDFVPRRKAVGTNYAYHQWLEDPVSQLATALGGYWGDVRPFAMTSGFQFRPSEEQSPDALVNAIETMAPPNTPPPYGDLRSYNAVHKWGEEVRMDPAGKITQPPAAGDAFFVAQFWAYDGTANLCAPSRLYNQIAAAVLAHIDITPSDTYSGVIDVHSTVDVARFYALVNMGMADAGIAAWDAKYHFQFPRPVTYIRANEQGAGPASGSTLKWYPVGAQITNSDQPYNITPPFPSYPSGHAVFGGALFGILRQFMKPTATFQFLSDEFNGGNKDAFNYIRCKHPEDKLTPNKFCVNRDFTLNCAERENADSRVFMGVHWVFDADDGIHMGNQVARQTYLNLMRPLDLQGNPHDPPSQLFSTDPTTVNTRAALVCHAIAYPAGWDNVDPKIGFGPLNVISVP
jgi:membrane-associated phospholipid phosphatase